MPRFRRRPSLSRRSGFTGGRVAAVVGAIGVALIVVVVLVPVLGLIGAAEGATATALEVPVLRIVAVVVLSLAVAAGLLLVASRAVRPVVSWLLVVAAWACALVGAVYPIIGVALSAVGQVGEVIPWIENLVRQVGGG